MELFFVIEYTDNKKDAEKILQHLKINDNDSYIKNSNGIVNKNFFVAP